MNPDEIIARITRETRPLVIAAVLYGAACGILLGYIALLVLA